MSAPLPKREGGSSRLKKRQKLREEGQQQQQQQQQQSSSTASRPCPSLETLSLIEQNVAARSGAGAVTSTSLAEERKEEEESEATSALHASAEENALIASYEYLDHTADIQLHSWGPTLAHALEALSLSMFSYMTDLSRVTVDKEISATISSSSAQIASSSAAIVSTSDGEEGASLSNVVITTGHDMQSLVFNFLDEWLFKFTGDGFIPKHIKVVDVEASEATTKFVVKSRGEGEMWDMNKHKQGTEVKAITYSNMQIIEKADGGSTKEDAKVHIYVIVDI
jgi:SHS2 domain-containing protein